MRRRDTGLRATKRRAAVKRFDTDPKVRQLVWVRAAGHCEMCGTDLTRDLRVGNSTCWGEAAHILPASPKGPRSVSGHTAAEARRRTNDVENLLLLCPSCHEKVDKDACGYPVEDLSEHHRAQVARIRLAAASPAHARAVPLLLLSRHFSTLNVIRDHDFLRAMSAEGLSATCPPVRIVLPDLPASGIRDEAYWRGVADQVHHQLAARLNRAGPESVDLLAVAALADIPALVMLGQVLGDRMPRLLFAPNRSTGLLWPEPEAEPPEFSFVEPERSHGPLALIVSLSARLPRRDVTDALPGARIAEFSIVEPSVAMVRNRRTIGAFRDAIQARLSELEAITDEPINLFMAIPAVLAVEFGALLTMQHRHTYKVYDRSESGAFELAVVLDHSQKASRP